VGKAQAPLVDEMRWWAGSAKVQPTRLVALLSFCYANYSARSQPCRPLICFKLWSDCLSKRDGSPRSYCSERWCSVSVGGTSSSSWRWVDHNHAVMQFQHIFVSALESFPQNVRVVQFCRCAAVTASQAGNLGSRQWTSSRVTAVNYW